MAMSQAGLRSGSDLGQEVGADGDEGDDGQGEEEAGNGNPGDAVDHQQVHQLEQRERRHCAEGHGFHIWHMPLLQQPACAALRSTNVMVFRAARHGSTLMDTAVAWTGAVPITQCSRLQKQHAGLHACMHGVCRSRMCTTETPSRPDESCHEAP